MQPEICLYFDCEKACDGQETETYVCCDSSAWLAQGKEEGKEMVQSDRPPRRLIRSGILMLHPVFIIRVSPPVQRLVSAGCVELKQER